VVRGVNHFQVILREDRRAHVLSWLAAAGIGLSVLAMVAASLVRSSWMRPPLVMPASGPPWMLSSVHVPAGMVTVGLWVAAFVGGAGVVAGLMAVRRGGRPSPRVFLAAAVLAVAAVAALAALPPAGSTDSLDYATYGRIMALGHSPYLFRPLHLRLAHNAFAQSVPVVWDRSASVYGPLATIEQFLAAKLGGASAARIVFWLKLWNALAFGIVAVVLDRLLRGDPARRLRAHLLWTVNPLLLWSLIAGGHLDVLGAAFGLLGLLVLGSRDGARYGEAAATRLRLPRVLAAGALLGLAAYIKINYLIFGLGLAWLLRRSPGALATAAGGALAVLVPAYALFGLPAVQTLVSRRDADNFYGLLFYPQHVWRPQIAVLAGILVIVVAVQLLQALPPGLPSWPVIRPALALSVAWLFFWPYQLPWYDTMVICLLVLYPATRLDWLVLLRLTGSTITNMPGNSSFHAGPTLSLVHRYILLFAGPSVLFAAGGCVILLCVFGWWNPRRVRDGQLAAAGRLPGAAAGRMRLLPRPRASAVTPPFAEPSLVAPFAEPSLVAPSAAEPPPGRSSPDRH
jgi:hypothetical protein